MHFVDEGTDSGPIILQKAVPVLDDDTHDTLADRILEQEHKALPEAVRLWSEGRLQIPEAVRLWSEGRLQIEGRHVKVLPVVG